MSASSKRRWFQFSLRTLILLMLVVGGGCGWLARWVEQGRRQEAAVAELAKLGAIITYEFQDENSAGNPIAAAPYGPEWLRKWLGDGFFNRVVAVEHWGPGSSKLPKLSGNRGAPQTRSRHDPSRFAPAPTTDNSIVLAARIFGIAGSIIRNLALTDDHMRLLADLAYLRRLSITSNPIGNTSMEHVAERPPIWKSWTYPAPMLTTTVFGI